MVDSRPSSQGHASITLELEGPDLTKLEQEAGGHRLQRIPPTERAGRVHTSTVTVSVLDPVQRSRVEINERDLRIDWFSGTGCGGQRRNKVQASCRIRHLPSGIVCTAQSRTRENSKKEAMEELVKRVNDLHGSTTKKAESATKRQQVGSGMRGDKIRTLRFQDNNAVDHITGKRMNADRYMKGYMDELWI